ncbi:MAG: dihydroorotate dehydrogenase, partial [Crenarchaeota archaeon]|nr:dihydroorotate dehydrogenase [Thermoproteota archaeon]
MNNDSITIDICGLKLRSPTALASGILGYSAKSLNLVADSGAGAVVTKSIGVNPREGYLNPSVFQAACGIINAMGLPNPGIDEYCKEIFLTKKTLSVPLIVSVYGYNADEYAILAKKATDAGADAIELNVSCPHVQYTGSEIGTDPKLLSDVVNKTRNAIKKPLIVKLSSNVTD